MIYLRYKQNKKYIAVEVKESDIKGEIKEGLDMLEMDYIGGHGSRGYGRVSLRSFATKIVGKVGLDASSIAAVIEG